jgi:chloramphenicol-sensitive protein RarD
VNDPADHRRGTWAAVAAFALWGLMPLYWHALRAVPSAQILLHRIVWSTVIVGGLLCWRQGFDWLRASLSRRGIAKWLALSGVLIGFNWGLYIWAVNAGHVVETSLGYFINPLFNVLIGVLFLREKLRPVQWVSIAIAGAGVLWLTLRFGQLPWIALALAGSFALYGLIRKLVHVEALPGLAIEGGYLLLPALAALGWIEAQGQGGFLSPHGGYGFAIDAMLVLAGLLTALPLIGFAYAVRRVPLSTVGVLQYIAPTLQFLAGVLVFREAFDRDRAIGFACIWIALLLFAGDGVLRARRAPA